MLEIDPENFEPEGQSKLLIDLVRCSNEGFVLRRLSDDTMDVEAEMQVLGCRRRGEIVGIFQRDHLVDDAPQPF